MFSKTIVAAAALMGARAFAESVGNAIVVNACSYDVYLFNTPSADGGYSEIDEVLSSGDSYSQQYTQLSNGNGWSLKLSKSTAMSNIMQYEYTFQDDGIIWYDLSDVNGNPWDGNWEITATSDDGECSPKQQAYRYATDDAYGMQACPQDSNITVTLCSGDDSDDSGAASASSVAASQSSIAATETTSTFSTPTSEAPSSYTSEAASTSYTRGSYSHTFGGKNDAVAASTSASPTTFATSTTAAVEVGGVTITEVQTAIVTDIVYATAYAEKRNEAVHRHEHHRRHHGNNQ